MRSATAAVTDAPNRRFSVTGQLSSARFVAAIARLSLGPLLPLLAESLHFSDRDTPALLSAYASGYILTQIAGGYLADRFGYRMIISASLFVSSVLVLYLSISSPGERTVEIWTKVYFVLGFVSGPLFPAGSAAITTEVPRGNRATAAAIVDAAAAAGTTVAASTPLLSTIVEGWRPIFRCTSAGLFLVATLFSSHSAADSATGYLTRTLSHDRTSNNGDASSGGGAISSGTLAEGVGGLYKLVVALLHPTAIGTYLCHGCDNFTKYSLSSWSATMLSQLHGVSPGWIGACLGMQEAVGFVSRILLSVYMSGKTLQSKRSMRNYRAVVSTMAFVSQATALWCIFDDQARLWQAVSGSVVSALAGGGHSIGYRPFYLEMDDRNAGSISGFGNTVASLASIAGPVLLGMAVAGSSSTEGDFSTKTDIGEASNSGQWSDVGEMLLWVNLAGAATSVVLLSTAGKRAVHVE